MVKIDPPVLPRLLYRYRTLTDDTIEREMAAIRERYLWFSAYRQLNDPMEGFYEATSRVQNHSDYRQIASEIYHAKCEIGICCLSDTKNNELMWVHYASDYAGICIGYDTRRLLDALPEAVHLARLAYAGRPPQIGKSDFAAPNDAAVKILSHKKASWAHEREWRLLGSLGRVDIVSNQCVSELYLGSRIQPHHRMRIESEFAHLSISISKMQLSGYDHRFTKVNTA